MTPSPQQTAVLQLVAEGVLMKNVADRMGLTIRAVEKHAFGARKALGAKTMPQAIAIAFRAGLLK